MGGGGDITLLEQARTGEKQDENNKAERAAKQKSHWPMPIQNGIEYIIRVLFFTKKGDEWPRGSTGADMGICNRSDCKNTLCQWTKDGIRSGVKNKKPKQKRL
jgi:hypothetical protein